MQSALQFDSNVVEIHQDPAPIWASAESLKNHLGEIWMEAAKLMQNTEEMISRFENTFSGSCNRSLSLPYRDGALKDVIHGAMNKLLVEWSAENRGISNKTITTRDLPDELDIYVGLKERDPGYDVRCGHITPAQFVSEQIERIDFESVVTYLESAKSSLEAEGLQDTARDVERLMGTRDGLALAQKGRWFESEFYIHHAHGTYRFDRVRDLRKLAALLKIVERETGLTGLGDSINGVANTYDCCKWDEQVPNRTVMSEGMPIEGVAMKGRVKLRMKQEVAEALISFVSLHAK